MKTRIFFRGMAFGVFLLLGLAIQSQDKKAVYRTVSIKQDASLPDSVVSVKDTVQILKDEWDQMISRDRERLKTEQAQKLTMEKHEKQLDKAIKDLPYVSAFPAPEVKSNVISYPDTIKTKSLQSRKKRFSIF